MSLKFQKLCFQYEAKKRISAVDAMKHHYFRSLGSAVHKLPDGELYYIRTLIFFNIESEKQKFSKIIQCLFYAPVEVLVTYNCISYTIYYFINKQLLIQLIVF